MSDCLLSIAPMIDWTHQHFRVFMRLLAPKAWLYTEMQTTGAVLHKPQKALQFDSKEHPIVLQLGGSDPQALAECARMVEQAGFDEINLNLGCPSDRVQAGQFGACLMGKPQLVSTCIQAMKQAVAIPVTAKIRIGIDEQDDYAFFESFVSMLVESGIDKLIVHARKAWLHGLNPKQNRTIPPLHYPFVYTLKKKFPHLPVIINGNIQDYPAIKTHLMQTDGVMLGRLACDNPWAIAVIHHTLYPEIPLPERTFILEQYLEYMKREQYKDTALSFLLKPLFNFFHGMPGARQWKHYLMRLLTEKKLPDEQTFFLAPMEF